MLTQSFLSKKLQAIVFFFIVSLLSIHGCTCEKSPQTLNGAKTAKDIPLWLKDGSIARVELARPSDGKVLARLQKKIPELHSTGFTAIWVSTIVPTSALYRQGEPTDPVPTQDFLSVADDFGTIDDFKAFVEQCHDTGLMVILDLALKYTAWDSKIVQEHPDWFRTNEEGAIVAPNIEWSNVADLNFEHHELRKYMIGVLRYWSNDIGVDGFAFQKADLIPLDFWERARKEVEATRPIVFLGQSNVPEHHLEVFDATYANDGGIPGFERREVPVGLSKMLENEATAFPAGYSRLRMSLVLSDYPQADTVSTPENPLDAVNTTLVYSLPGIPVTVLKMERLNQRSSLQTSLALVAKLNSLRQEHNEMVSGGIIERKLSESETFFAYERRLQNIRILFLLNYAPEPQDILLQLPQNFQGGFGDFLSGATILPAEGNLRFFVRPQDAKILTRTSEGTPR